MVHFLWICPSLCEFSAHFNSFVNVDENNSWVQKMGLHLGHILLQMLLFCSWTGKGVSEGVLRGDKCQLLSGPFLKTHRALDLSPPFLSQTTTPLQFGGKTCQDCRCLWELDPSPPTTSISRYPFLENLEHLPLGHSTAHLHLGKALQRLANNADCIDSISPDPLSPPPAPCQLPTRTYKSRKEKGLAPLIPPVAEISEVNWLQSAPHFPTASRRILREQRCGRSLKRFWK